ncbi:uncharacterized protein N0V96_004412 [Colletotrichum fioriniae]|uniref:uncharacterized protein n=1 Tax=Colletotrichum fioriniae TaxID=710243 RepID=UPI0032DBB251|nr:hypothetical protein N0V96_004412 [Colletotrichum fioriniae]
MKPSTLLPLTATLAAAVDMAPYKPSAGVDVAFADFVSEYYRTSEDKAATTTFTNFWPADGKMILAGRTFTGATAMLSVKQSLLPPNGNKSCGSAAFTVLKDAQGTPRLEPHSESLSVYGLTVSTTDSPTDIPCSSS